MTRKEIEKLIENRQPLNFKGKNLSGVNLSFLNLTEADFTDANLINANLNYCILKNTTFTNAILVDKITQI